MKQAHKRTLINGLALAWLAALAIPAWGQSAVWKPLGATTGSIYYDGGFVGIGTNSPQSPLDVYAPGSPTFYLRDNTAAFKFAPWNGNNYIESGSNVAASDSRADLYFTSMHAGTTFMTIQGATGNIGIKTTSPLGKLEIWGDSTPNPGTGAEPTYKGTIRIVDSGAAVNNNLGGLEFKAATSGSGYGFRIYNPDLGTGEAPLYIQRRSNSPTWTTALTILGSNGNVGIGTVNPQYLLSVNGVIGAKDITVTNTGWSDYVFRPDYRLRPLSEVNAYIQAHRHLPDIPSEAEVKEKGVSVGDMQAKLLAKIEELTLHVIRQEEENGNLRRRVEQLENRTADSGEVGIAPAR